MLSYELLPSIVRSCSVRYALSYIVNVKFGGVNFYSLHMYIHIYLLLEGAGGIRDDPGPVHRPLHPPRL